MKVLFFVRERHPTFRVDVTVLFGKYLSRLGVRSDLVTLREAGKAGEWGGGEVFGPPAGGGRVRTHLAALANDFRSLARIGPEYDMVVVRDKPLFTLWAWLVARLRGVPFAYWMSFPLPESALEFARERGPSIGLLRWLVVYARGLLSYATLYRIVLPRADVAFLQSDEMVRVLQARGIRMRRPVAVPMGVDREAIDAIVARDDTGGDTGIDARAADWLARARAAETIVYLGTVEENRRLELALYAFRQVLAARPQALLLIIGNADEPGDIEKLKSLARELGLADRVVFTGWLDMATAWRLVRASRVGFSPCPRGVLYDVASPTKAVEYMALGLPVVANDLPDQAYVIGRSGGGLCTPLDPDAFAAAMIELLSDRGAADARGRAGREWALENRNYERLATEVRDAMRAAMAGPPGRIGQNTPALHEAPDRPSGVMSKRVLMVCTAGRGGMLSVIESYRVDGLFDRWNVQLFSPHDEGSLARRLYLAAVEILRFLVDILTHRVTLVHCHAAELGSFWRKSIFGLLARARRIPVLFHLHGAEMKDFYDGQAAPVRRLISWILERYSAVVVLSPSWADWVRSVAPKARVFVLHNYVRMPAIEARRPNDGTIDVLFLGIIGHRKGVYDLLPAFAAAHAAHPTLRLRIGGNGEVDEARMRAAELGLGDAVEFLGWVGGDRKNELLARADIFVLPSYNEGLPISLLEAMSWAVPVVSTRVGGIPELIRDGVDGLLIDAGDTAALTAALSRLAADAGVRERMGRAGREQVEGEFSREAVLPRLEQLYTDIAKAGE